jgi:L-alanine-DL-glutamate epimerase-like enolase superfamily enzyme
MVGLILRMDAADIINTKCAKAGGIRGVRAWAAAAETFNRPVVEFTEIMIHELLLKEPRVLAEGHLQVPVGPGLGLERGGGQPVRARHSTQRRKPGGRPAARGSKGMKPRARAGDSGSRR